MGTADESIFYDLIYPHFQKICNIKHPSGDEKELIQFVQDFADNLNLKNVTDSLGNVAVYKNASAGMENKPALLFQGHLDMVCVPDKNIFPVKPVITDGWVHTEGTSLGADNGIAIAIMLELMKMDFDKNPPLEFLFTISEEVGLIGASKIDTDKIKLSASKLINIDSEEIDFITIGCAGGQDLEIYIDTSLQDNKSEKALKISVTGPGGHSGIVINEKIPNALRILAELIDRLNDVSIAEISGGMARNAIPPDAQAVISSDTLSEADVIKEVENLKGKYIDFKPFEVDIEKVSNPNNILKDESAEKIIYLLLELPHGVIKNNPDTGGILSSINLALLQQKDNSFVLSVNSRSSDSNEINEIFNNVESICSKKAGINPKREDGYPGWRPNVDSELLKTASGVFEKALGKKPELLDIHAGLECGILMDKFPVIKEAISIGPNLFEVHSVKERLEIESTIKIWDIILKLINEYC
ncbi:beta-Ala-His dipeptidase [candidate division KSB1 bacterium]